MSHIAFCLGCGKKVRLNKPIIGSLHLCASPEDLARREQAWHQAWRQRAFTPSSQRQQDIIAQLLDPPQSTADGRR